MEDCQEGNALSIVERIQEEMEKETAHCSPFRELEIMRMEKIWSVEPETRRCFLFISSENGRFALDAFIWDQDLQNHYYRFHISFFSVLSESEKQLLEKYCQYDDIKVKKGELNDVLWVYREDFPDITTWEKSNPFWIVHRIYYMQHPGIRRMLYEAGLHWFAMEWGSFNDFNLAGSTLTEIMDGIPKSLFGKMNTKHSVAMLKDYDRRIFFQKAYFWYPELFREPWNKYQCHFFENYIWPEGLYVHTEFNDILNEENREILKGIGSFKSTNAYGRYLCYKETRDAMVDVLWLPCFPWKERYSLYRIAEVLYKYYMAEDAQQTRGLVEQNLCSCTEYEAWDEKYIVRSPYDLAEFMEECQITGNVLWIELKHVSDGTVKFMFCRLADDPEQTFCIFEISDGRMTVFQSNQYLECEEETKEWFRQYAASKNLTWTGDV